MMSKDAAPVEESVELLPCPFCGGEPRRYTANPYPGFEDRQVQCDRCGASAFDSKWNTRADPAIAAAYEAGRAEGVRAAAEVTDAEAALRRGHMAVAKAAGIKKEARDFETMMIAHVQSATAIRALSKEPTK